MTVVLVCIACLLAGFALAASLAMIKRNAELARRVLEVETGHENTTALAARAVKTARRGAAEPEGASAELPMPRVVAAMQGNASYSTSSMNSHSMGGLMTETNEGQKQLEAASVRRQLHEEVALVDERARQSHAGLSRQLDEIVRRLDAIENGEPVSKAAHGGAVDELKAAHDKNVVNTKAAFDVVQQAILTLQTRIDTAEKVATAAQQLTDKIETAHQAVSQVTTANADLNQRLGACEGNIAVMGEQLSKSATSDSVAAVAAAGVRNAGAVVALGERFQTLEREHDGTRALVGTHQERLYEITGKLVNVDRVYEATDMINKLLPVVQDNAKRADLAATAAVTASAKLSGETGEWDAKISAVSDTATAAFALAKTLEGNGYKLQQDYDHNQHAMVTRIEKIEQAHKSTSDAIADTHADANRQIEAIRRETVSGLSGMAVRLMDIESVASAAHAKADAAAPVDVSAIQSAAERVAAADASAAQNAEVLARIGKSVDSVSQQIDAVIDAIGNHGDNIRGLGSSIATEKAERASADDVTRTELGKAIDGLSITVGEMARHMQALSSRVEKGIVDPRVDALLAEHKAAKQRRAQIVTGSVAPPAPAGQPNPNIAPQ